MERLINVIFLLFTFTIFGSVSLSNNDSRKHDLYIDHGNSAVHTSLNGKTTTIVCPKGCTIKVKTSGNSIKAAEGDKIIIKNGKLSKK